MRTNEIFARCKVAKLAGLYIDAELLNCNAPTIDIVNNYIANKENILINPNDIFAPIEEASMFGDIPEEEYLARYDNKKEKAVLSYAELHRDFKTNCPDLFREIGTTVFIASSKEKKAEAKRKRPVDPRKLELKEKIRAIYARDNSSLSNKPKIRTAVSNLEPRTDIVYSSGEAVRNTPFATFFNEHQEFTTEENQEVQEIQKETSSSNNQKTMFSRIRPTQAKETALVNNEQTQVSTNGTSSLNESTTETFQTQPDVRKPSYYSNTYEYKPTFIAERQALCEEIFGLSQIEFDKKLNYSTDILSCTEEQLYESKENLLTITPLEEKHLASFVKVLPLPVPEFVAKKVAEKIDTYGKYGLTLDDLAQNFIILRGNQNRTETKIKLAFVNHIYSDTFVRGACRNNEAAVWARMQANKNGLTDFNKYYIEEEVFRNETGLRTEELMAKYPLDEQALAEIDELYNQELANGYKWKKSFRLYSQQAQRTVNPDLSNGESVTTEKDKVTDAKQTIAEPQEKIIEESFVPAKSFEEIPSDRKTELMEIFGCSITELEKAVAVYPELLAINPKDLQSLRETFIQDYGFTDKEFAKALRTDISLANRTIEAIEDFRTYCKEYLLFSDEQIKEVLTKAPEMIGRNKEEIYKRACIIAQELNSPFPQVTNALIRCKRLYTDSTDKLSSKLKKLKTIFTKEEILSHPSAIAVNENSVKLRFMLNMINGEPVEEFLDRNYFTRESKVYARTMANFIYGTNIGVYNASANFARQFKNTLEAKGVSHHFSFDQDLDEQLMKLYPLGEVQKKQIERLYNDKNSSRKLQLTEEEIEYGK